MISDRGLLVEHPWNSKYDIQIPSSDTYYLVVRAVQLSDVGRYTCVNAAGGPPCGAGNTANRASADLSVISENIIFHILVSGLHTACRPREIEID